MAYKSKWKSGGMGEGQIDSSYGVIMRLNYLWAEADRKALGGNMEDWNFVLDRILANLSYDDSIDYQEDSEGKIISVMLSHKSKQISDWFRKELQAIQYNRRTAVKNKDRVKYNQSRQDHYDLLMKKDVWLRNLMQEKKLYLKTVEHSPSTAMWGG